MNDNQPRPMPQIVAAAYRRDLDLGSLLVSRVFTDADRISVRDQLLEQLIAKHGSVEVKYGRNWIPIRRRIEQIQARSTKLVRGVWPTIDLLMKIDEYGLREGVLNQLAGIMEPYWQQWWSRFSWEKREGVRLWVDAVEIVLGIRQIRWISAQHARVFLSRGNEEIAEICLRAILIAEANAAGNDIYSAEEEAETRERVQTLYGLMYARGSRDVELSLNSAGRAISPYVIGEGSYMFAESRLLNSEDRKKLEGITRELITPTLITNAARAM